MQSSAPQSGGIGHLLKEFYDQFRNRYNPVLNHPFGWVSEYSDMLRRLFVVLLLNPYLQTIILLAQSLWLILILLLMTYWPLSAMDQANDAFQALVSEKPTWAFFGHLTAFGFAVTVWFCCRMLFIRFNFKRLRERVNVNTEFDEFTEDKLQNFVKWVPPLLGAVPLGIFAMGLAGAENSSTQLVLVAVDLVIYAYVLSLNSDYLDDRSTNGDYLSLDEHTFTKLRVPYQRANYVIGFVIGILFVLFAWYDANIFLSRCIGIIAVLFTAMSLWVFLAYSLMRLDYAYGVPIAVVVLGIVAFFWNTNNHQIQTCPEGYLTKQEAGNLGIGPHFARWIESRHESIRRWQQNPANHWDTINHRSELYPVYIVASEGGGLRAAYWTASVLGQLSQQIPHFYERVYALSTVSGGSVGAAVYTKLYRDSLALGRLPAWQGQTVYTKAKAILKQDYLSPLVGAFLIPDMAQKLLPIGINSFDRARYLENSLSDEYARIIGGNSSMNTPFLHLWSGTGRKGSYWYQVPALFMNCTRVEDGQKAILSNLEITGPAFQGINNQNVIDLQDRIHKHIPLKTAAFMSARFPIVTPPATIQANTTKRQDMMTIVDGGYIDNSGLETALAVITSIRQDAAKAMSQLIKTGSVTPARKAALMDDLGRIELHLILIKSSEQSDEERMPNRGLYEIRGPLTAFFNSWDINIGSKLNVAHAYLRLAANEKTDPTRSATDCTSPKPVGIPVDKELVVFDLNRKQQVIPLGWFMSDTARRCVDRQADLIKQRFAQSIKQNLAHQHP